MKFARMHSKKKSAQQGQTGFVRPVADNPPKDYGYRSNGVYYPLGYTAPVPRELVLPENGESAVLNVEQHARVQIYMMLENRPFPQIVGGAFQDRFGPKFPGISNPNAGGRKDDDPGCWVEDLYGEWRPWNPDLKGNWYRVRPTTWRDAPMNPEHSYQDCMRQVSYKHDGSLPVNIPFLSEYYPEADAAELERIRQHLVGEFRKLIDAQGMGNCLGFVANYHSHYPDATQEQLQHILEYFPRGFLKGFHTLAEHGVVFANAHPDVLGPTWPNRKFSLAGTCNGYGNMPGETVVTKDAFEHWYKIFNMNIFHQLLDKGVPFKMYFHDAALPLLWAENRDPEVLSRMRPIEELWEDLKQHPDDMPFVIYIDPCYQGAGENDGHPPNDIWKTDLFVSTLYNAIRGNEELWKVVAWFLTWDEHGGYFDPVNPPACTPPDGEQHEMPCNQLGIRIATLLVSPLVPHGWVPNVVSNSSWLKYMQELFGLTPLPSKRVAEALSYGALFEMEGDRVEWPLYIEYSDEDFVKDVDLDQEGETMESINHLHIGYVHGMSFIGLYRFPRILTKVMRKYMGVKYWVQKHTSAARKHEGTVFDLPGVGIYTNKKDGVDAYLGAIDDTRAMAKRAQRKQERAQKKVDRAAAKAAKKSGNKGKPDAEPTAKRGI